MTADRPIVLVISDFYLPGYKSGGGMRSVVNMVDRFRDRYDFRIVTRDHDGNRDKTPYASVKINEWNDLDGIPVHYVSNNRLTMRNLRRLHQAVDPSLVYSNSLFTPAAIRVAQLRKFGMLPPIPMVIAPCGELSAGALAIKSRRKTAFVTCSKLINLYHGIIWRASSDLEATDIRNAVGASEDVRVAPDLLPLSYYPKGNAPTKPPKITGTARFVFFSRLVRIKNLLWLLELLREAPEGNIQVDVLGPIEDQEYWRECQELARRLPANVQIRAVGDVPHEKVIETLAAYEFFVSPTLNENFGHVFLEALAAGCPILISDRTPWRDLAAKGIGWDLRLDTPDEWLRVLTNCVQMDDATYGPMSEQARQFASDVVRDPLLEHSTADLLKYALNQRELP